MVFIVDDLYEELFVKKIYGKLLSFKSINKVDEIIISIVLNNYCNYKCNYCITKTPNNKIKKDININFIIFLLKYMKKIKFNKKFRITLLGGEPTLYNNLFNVIDIINEYYNINIKILTNGSMPINYYHNIISKSNIELVVSYHPEFANDNNIKNLLKSFNENNYNNYTLDILLEYKYYDKINNFINNLDDIYLTNIRCMPLAGIDYINSKYNKFNNLLSKHENNNLYILKFENNEIKLDLSTLISLNSSNNMFKGMQCDIYNEHWFIDYDNIGMECCNKNYNLLNGGIIRFFKDFNNFKNGIKCNNNTCISDCLLNVNKWYKNDYLL